MIFKAYECDFGFVINGTTYRFDHVISLQIDDPERSDLRRGANASNTTGIVYRSGLTEPKVTTVTILGVTKDVHALLKDAFKNQTRMDQFVINKFDGSSKTTKDSVLQQDPKQMTLDDSPESMQMQLVFASFDVSESHKT